MSDAAPNPEKTPIALLGGPDAARALVERFYDAMDAHEPELARLHVLDADGRVSRESRDHFALFLIGWLGGAQDYTAQRGPPRLRMRHAAFPVTLAMRDAWLRAMTRALDEGGVSGPVRGFLDTRFADVADFLRNRPE
jgi:hemoglobin